MNNIYIHLLKKINSTNIYLAFTTCKSVSNLMDKDMKEEYMYSYTKTMIQAESYEIWEVFRML